MTREEAIYLLNNLRAFAEEDDDPAIDMAIEALQEERTGEWEEVQGCKGYLCCSECGRFVNVAHKCNFCPNCGAKMGGDTE